MKPFKFAISNSNSFCWFPLHQFHGTASESPVKGLRNVSIQHCWNIQGGQGTFHGLAHLASSVCRHDLSFWIWMKFDTVYQPSGHLTDCKQHSNKVVQHPPIFNEELIFTRCICCHYRYMWYVYLCVTDVSALLIIFWGIVTKDRFLEFGEWSTYIYQGIPTTKGAKFRLWTWWVVIANASLKRHIM